MESFPPFPGVHVIDLTALTAEQIQERLGEGATALPALLLKRGPGLARGSAERRRRLTLRPGTWGFGRALRGVSGNTAERL